MYLYLYIYFNDTVTLHAGPKTCYVEFKSPKIQFGIEWVLNVDCLHFISCDDVQRPQIASLNRSLILSFSADYVQKTALDFRVASDGAWN